MIILYDNFIIHSYPNCKKKNIVLFCRESVPRIKKRNYSLNLVFYKGESNTRTNLGRFEIYIFYIIQIVRIKIQVARGLYL